MNTWKGTTTEGIVSDRFRDQNYVSHFILVNKSSSAVTVNLSVGTDEEGIYIIPKDLSIPVGAAYEGGGISIEDREALQLAVSGEIDFYFAFHKSYPESNTFAPFAGEAIQQHLING